MSEPPGLGIQVLVKLECTIESVKFRVAVVRQDIPIFELDVQREPGPRTQVRSLGLLDTEVTPDTWEMTQDQDDATYDNWQDPFTNASFTSMVLLYCRAFSQTLCCNADAQYESEECTSK